MDIEDLREGDFGTHFRRGASRTEMWHHQKMSEAHMRQQVKDWSPDEIFRWCRQISRGDSIAEAESAGDLVVAGHIRQSAYSAAALLGMRCWLDAQDAKDEESQQQGDENVTG